MSGILLRMQHSSVRGRLIGRTLGFGPRGWGSNPCPEMKGKYE